VSEGEGGGEEVEAERRPRKSPTFAAAAAAEGDSTPLRPAAVEEAGDRAGGGFHGRWWPFVP
jgi:hypothetical protein